MKSAQGYYMSDAVKSTVKVFKRSPQELLTIIIVVSFIFYLYQHDKLENENAAREDLVAKQRITTCHNIQEDANQIMRALAQTLEMQRKSFYELSASIRNLKEDELSEIKKTLEESNRKMETFMYKMDSLDRKLDRLIPQ